MKQVSINEVIEAFGDEPVAIEERLKTLGAGEEDISKFSQDLLSTKIYASSFVKFLSDNREKLQQEVLVPAKDLPEGWIDPFAEGGMTVLDRFVAMGFAPDEMTPMFSEDTLKLYLTSDEFQDLIQTSQDKIFGRAGELANQES